VPKPRDQCSKGEQLVVTFAAGYIAGVFCAIVSHPADTVVSKLNQNKEATVGAILKELGPKGKLFSMQTFLLTVELQSIKGPGPPLQHHARPLGREVTLRQSRTLSGTRLLFIEPSLNVKKLRGV